MTSFHTTRSSSPIASKSANLVIAAALLLVLLWMMLAPSATALPLLASLPPLRGVQPPPRATSLPRAISVASFRSPDRFCRANPYLSDWDDARFLSAAEGLVAFRASQNGVALEEKWRAPEWGRFDASPGAQPCVHLARYPPDPAVEDGYKFLCNLASLRPGCVVYSLGSNGQFEFELLMAKATPCSIFTFDCTLKDPTAAAAQIAAAAGGGRVHFLPTCVGASDGERFEAGVAHSGGGGGGGGSPDFRTLSTLMAQLNHTRVDVLKMDIEGFEYRVIEGLFAEVLRSGDDRFLPMQLVLELHARSGHVAGALALLDPPDPAAKQKVAWYNRGGLSAGDMQVVWTQLTDLGYVVVKRDNNVGFHGGAEFTLLRAFC